ncbi:host specificity factor TipJ family phage tail protein [Nitrobacteraceae bacterium UC4446_H13]
MRHETVKDGEPVGLLALPHIDPTRGRRRLDVAYGMTVGEMVAMALPEVSHARIRVSIGEHVIDPKIWHRVRPHHGATVIVRAVPGDDTLRSVLSVAVLVAAVALGQFYAPTIAGALLPSTFTGYGATVATASTISAVGSLATAGFAVAGSLLLNALIPVRGLGDQDKGTDRFAITGLQNSSNPGGVIPSILGRHRYAPVYAAPPYTEIIGTEQYVIAAFLFGHGGLNIANHRLGDTPIENFQDVQLEVREGYETDAPLTLYPQQIIEEQISVELRGNEPISRLTARDATEVSVDISFVQGLVKFGKEGKKEWRTVSFAISQRPAGSTDGASVVTTLDFTANRQEIIRQSYRWTLPQRGQYEIFIMRVSPNATDAQIIDRSDWSAIRSFRPESPFNFKDKLAMVALRIRASNQLNGVVNNYSGVASLLCRDWDKDGQAWVVRETSNPASLFRHVLQGPANAFRKTDDEIDLAKLQEWHEFCEEKGLTYNRVHDYNATRLDVLADIAAAGRATPHDDGERWSVTIDRPQSTYVSAISPRNSWDFQGTTPQVQFPDGHRVQFIDATNDWQEMERIVPFPGVDPDNVQVTEDLPLPGVTDPNQIWLATRRRQYELIHRPHTYKVSQDIESLVLARGDLVPVNHDVLDRDQVSARVRTVSGQIATLDTPVQMVAGRSYACVFRLADGTTLRRSVVTVDGETPNLTVVGDLVVAAGDLASFGTSIKGPVIDCIVKSIERGDNMTANLTLVDAAPIIDELVDAEIPPPWDGRVGEATDVSGLVPATPSIDVTDAYLQFIVAVTPGTDAIALPATFSISYRLHGGGAFTVVSIPASQAFLSINGFSVGDAIDLKARAVSAYGQSSAETTIVQATLHAAETQTPTFDSTDVHFDNTTLTWDHF